VAKLLAGGYRDHTVCVLHIYVSKQTCLIHAQTLPQTYPKTLNSFSTNRNCRSYLQATPNKTPIVWKSKWAILHLIQINSTGRISISTADSCLFRQTV